MGYNVLIRFEVTVKVKVIILVWVEEDWAVISWINFIIKRIQMHEIVLHVLPWATTV